MVTENEIGIWDCGSNKISSPIFVKGERRVLMLFKDPQSSAQLIFAI